MSDLARALATPPGGSRDAAMREWTALRFTLVYMVSRDGAWFAVLRKACPSSPVEVVEYDDGAVLLLSDSHWTGCLKAVIDRDLPGDLLPGAFARRMAEAAAREKEVDDLICSVWAACRRQPRPSPPVSILKVGRKALAGRALAGRVTFAV